jgi:hypothetical protein
MLPFSPKPGGHERMLKRRMGNPLYPEDQRKIKESELLEAQHRDFEEVQAFLEDFQKLVEEAAGLEANADSEQILSLKERLDAAYERCVGLGGDMEHIRLALQRLIQVIMNAVRKAAADDDTAMEKLSMEDDARFMHYVLLEHPFIADMLRPDDLLSEADLVPCLLAESETVVAEASKLFEPEQLFQICQKAEELVLALEEKGADSTEYRKNYMVLRGMLEQVKEQA